MLIGINNRNHEGITRCLKDAYVNGSVVVDMHASQ
jgi:hypothetical protein